MRVRTCVRVCVRACVYDLVGVRCGCGADAQTSLQMTITGHPIIGTGKTKANC